MRFWTVQAGISAALAGLAMGGAQGCGSSTSSAPCESPCLLVGPGVCDCPDGAAPSCDAIPTAGGNSGPANCLLESLDGGGCRLGFGATCAAVNVGGGIPWNSATCANGTCVCENPGCACTMAEDAGDTCVTSVTCCPSYE